MRVDEKIFRCPICQEKLASKAWSPPMCPKGCNKEMVRVISGRDAVFIKQ